MKSIFSIIKSQNITVQNTVIEDIILLELRIDDEGNYEKGFSYVLQPQVQLLNWTTQMLQEIVANWSLCIIEHSYCNSEFLKQVPLIEPKSFMILHEEHPMQWRKIKFRSHSILEQWYFNFYLVLERFQEFIIQ